MLDRDDSSINLRILCRILEQEGCICSTAHDGSEAIDLYIKRWNLAHGIKTKEGDSPNGIASSPTASPKADTPKVGQAILPPFSIIFSDILMPVLDGLSACRFLRTWEAQQLVDNAALAAPMPFLGPLPVPICSVSANALVQDRQACFEAGFSCHLSKPFHRKQIGMILNKFVPNPKAKEPRSVPKPPESFADFPQN
jgi:CheY-like chemotaxis protein